MTPKTRFINALYRRPTDRVPLFDFLFQQPLFAQVLGRMPETYNALDAMALTRKLELDGVWIPFGCFSGWAPEQLGANIYKDEWGTTFERTASSWPIDAPIAYPLSSSADLARYSAPDPRAPGRLDEIQTAVAINRDRNADAVAVLGGVTGPLTLAWMLTGYEQICLAIYDDPELLAGIAQLAVDFALPAITQMADAGVDGFFISEDLGSGTGGLLAPAQYREFFYPALARMVEQIHARQLPVIVHSCGCIEAFLDDLVALGIDGLHPLQRTAGMSLASVKARYGDRLCLIGNIDSSRTLPYGSIDDVRRETREALAAGMPGGGYILASDHSLHDGIPIANILAMLETGRRWGEYPQNANR